MGKVNRVELIARPHQDGIGLERDLLEVGREQAEIRRRQRRKQPIADASAVDGPHAFL
jgi:hypothetical protein